MPPTSLPGANERTGNMKSLCCERASHMTTVYGNTHAGATEWL